MRSLGWRGVGVVAVLIFAVRPISVWLCTRGSELTRNERWFVAWIAPRGIVAAAVASVTASALESAGMPGGPEIRALVFLTIAATVVLAGVTGVPLASLLRVRLPGRETVAILGAHGLGLSLGAALRDGGRPVMFLDSNPDNCRQAEEAGFPVVFGDALQERTMQRARFERVGVAIGVTANQMLNSVFVSRAHDFFKVPEGYIAVVRPDLGIAPDLVDKGDAHMLFDGPHEVERWDVRARHGDLAIELWEYVGEAAERAEEGSLQRQRALRARQRRPRQARAPHTSGPRPGQGRCGDRRRLYAAARGCRESAPWTGLRASRRGAGRPEGLDTGLKKVIFVK